MKKKLLLVSLFLFFSILFGIFILTPLTLNKQDGIMWYLKALVPEKLKIIIKDNFLSSKLLKIENNKLNKTLEKVNDNYYVLRVSKKLKNIETSEIISKKKVTYSLKKIILPFDAQTAWKGKPSGYIEEYNNFLIISSGKGEFIKINKNNLNLNPIQFQTIKTNLTDFIKFEGFYKPSNYGIRDLKIIDKTLYVSYPKKSKFGCYNISLLKADLTSFNAYLNFQEFFNFDKCLGSWESTRSGGRIEKFKDKVLLTVGDYGLEVSESAQNLDHPFGKIILIDKSNKNFKLVSYGHRNAQGLYFDEENDILLETEHGPNGGDEVNKINLKNDLKNNNYGWPIASYGTHYNGTIKKHKEQGSFEKLMKTSPLNKSHKDFGFIEPIKNWTPSIGVSQITKINKNFLVNADNDFFVASLGNNIPEGDMTIHHLTFSKNFNKLISEDRIVIGERIRDIFFSKTLNKILMITENSPSLSILEVN